MGLRLFNGKGGRVSQDVWEGKGVLDGDGNGDESALGLALLFWFRGGERGRGRDEGVDCFWSWQ